MTKDEALKMAIERLKTYHAVFCKNDDPNYGNEIIKALEQPTNMVTIPISELEKMKQELKELRAQSKKWQGFARRTA